MFSLALLHEHEAIARATCGAAAKDETTARRSHPDLQKYPEFEKIH
jgi:hypothetical protein